MAGSTNNYWKFLLTTNLVLNMQTTGCVTFDSVQGQGDELTIHRITTRRLRLKTSRFTTPTKPTGWELLGRGAGSLHLRSQVGLLPYPRYGVGQDIKVRSRVGPTELPLFELPYIWRLGSTPRFSPRWNPTWLILSSPGKVAPLFQVPAGTVVLLDPSPLVIALSPRNTKPRFG